jgi:hypothetical protein
VCGRAALAHILSVVVTVDRQVLTVPGRGAMFGPPKSKASVRTIPLPEVVIEEMVEPRCCVDRPSPHRCAVVRPSGAAGHGLTCTRRLGQRMPFYAR